MEKANFCAGVRIFLQGFVFLPLEGSLFPLAKAEQIGKDT